MAHRQECLCYFGRTQTGMSVLLWAHTDRNVCATLGAKRESEKCPGESIGTEIVSLPEPEFRGGRGGDVLLIKIGPESLDKSIIEDKMCHPEKLRL